MDRACPPAGTISSFVSGTCFPRLLLQKGVLQEDKKTKEASLSEAAFSLPCPIEHITMAASTSSTHINIRVLVATTGVTYKVSLLPTELT